VLVPGDPRARMGRARCWEKTGSRDLRSSFNLSMLFHRARNQPWAVPSLPYADPGFTAVHAAPEGSFEDGNRSQLYRGASAHPLPPGRCWRRVPMPDPGGRNVVPGRPRRPNGHRETRRGRESRWITVRQVSSNGPGVTTMAAEAIQLHDALRAGSPVSCGHRGGHRARGNSFFSVRDELPGLCISLRGGRAGFAGVLPGRNSTRMPLRDCCVDQLLPRGSPAKLEKAPR